MGQVGPSRTPLAGRPLFFPAAGAAFSNVAAGSLGLTRLTGPSWRKIAALACRQLATLSIMSARKFTFLTSLILRAEDL